MFSGIGYKNLSKMKQSERFSKISLKVRKLWGKKFWSSM